MPASAELLALARVAERHGGVFTRADAERAGLSARQCRRLLDAGHWVAEHPGVWRAASTPRTLDLRERAALRWLGDRALLSHLSAARRYGMAVPRSSEVWVTLPSVLKPRPAPGLSVVRTTSELRRVEVDGVPCVEPARALADLAQCLLPDALRSALLQSIQRRQARLERLSEIADELGNRAGNRELRRLLRLFDPATESWLEDQWVAGLRRLRITGWQQQLLIVGSDGRVVARADFGDPEARLAVQLDGFAYHCTVEQLRRDKAMDRAAARAGYLTVRYDAREVLRRRDECIREVEQLRVDRLGRRA